MASSPSPVFSHFLNRVRQYWSERNSRERRMLVSMILVVSVAILWLLYDWQATEKLKLDKQIPLAQAQVKGMQEQAAELSRLKSQAEKPAFDAAQVTTLLQGSASAQALKLTIRAEGSRISVSGDDIDFDRWVVWLANAQTTHGLKATALQANTGKDSEHVQATLEPVR